MLIGLQISNIVLIEKLALFAGALRDQGLTIGLGEVMDAALPNVTDRTLIIIEGIRDSKEKLVWWESLQKSPLTGISYDLGSIGLLFFDRARHKNTYWINLRRR